MSNYLYKYFQEEGKIRRVHIEQDNEPWNPRTEQDGNVGTMMCWYRNYDLGDSNKNKYKNPEDFLQNLLHQKVSEKTILNYVRNGKADDIEIKHNQNDYI